MYVRCLRLNITWLMKATSILWWNMRVYPKPCISHKHTHTATGFDKIKRIENFYFFDCCCRFVVVVVFHSYQIFFELLNNMVRSLTMSENFIFGTNLIHFTSEKRVHPNHWLQYLHFVFFFVVAEVSTLIIT